MSSPEKTAARTLGFTQDDFMQDIELEAGDDDEPVDAALRWNALVGRLLRSSRGRGGAGDSFSRLGPTHYAYSARQSVEATAGSISSVSLLSEEESMEFDGGSEFPRLALFDDP